MRIHREEPGTLVLDEFGLCQGVARVDVAVINGQMNGYEIKSNSDTLQRLPGQIEVYNQVLDSIILVTGIRHAKHAIRLIPAWWGIIGATGNRADVQFEVIREPALNPSCEPYAIAQLLWRDEALAVLEMYQLHKGLKSKPRQALWQMLSAQLPPAVLKEVVRTTLKARGNWRNWTFLPNR